MLGSARIRPGLSHEKPPDDRRPKERADDPLGLREAESIRELRLPTKDEAHDLPHQRYDQAADRVGSDQATHRVTRSYLPSNGGRRSAGVQAISLQMRGCREGRAAM